MTEGAQTINGVKTFDNNGIKIEDSNASHGVTISPGDESADRVLSIPVLGGADTVVTLATTQTLSGPKTVSTRLLTSANVGTVETGTTAVEYGDGSNHVTVLTVSSTLGAIAGGADLGLGKLLYTLPAGAIAIHSANMSMAITQTQGNITADTPDGGLGSVIASGAVAVLSGTATFEDILTGQTFNDCNGTAEVKTVSNQPMVMEAGAAHTVHFNVADGWAVNGDAAAIIAGTVRLVWSFLG